MADETPEPTYHVVSVQYCGNGPRGLFVHIREQDGVTGVHDRLEPWTEDEMNAYLGHFAMILRPESMEITAARLREYTIMRPLPEYKNHFGIAYRQIDADAMEQK